MARIKVNVRYNERENRLYYRNFEIVEELPECKNVKEAHIDFPTLSNEALDYKFYECEIEEEDEEESSFEYYAISKYLDKKIEIKENDNSITVIVSEKKPDPISKELNRRSFEIKTDSVEFEDEFEMEDFIQENIIDNVNGWFCLNDDDLTETCNKLEEMLKKYIVEEGE